MNYIYRQTHHRRTGFINYSSQKDPSYWSNLAEAHVAARQREWIFLLTLRKEFTPILFTKENKQIQEIFAIRMEEKLKHLVMFNNFYFQQMAGFSSFKWSRLLF